MHNVTDSSRTQWTLPVIFATMPAAFRVMCKFYRATKNPSYSATTAQLQMSMLRRELFESSTLNGTSSFEMTRATRPSQQRDSSAIDQRMRARTNTAHAGIVAKRRRGPYCPVFGRDRTVRILYWKMASMSLARSKKAPADARPSRIRRSRPSSGASKPEPSQTHMVRPLRGRDLPVP